MAVHGEGFAHFDTLVGIVLGVLFGAFGLNALVNGYVDLGKRKVTRYRRDERPIVFWSVVVGCLLFAMSCAVSLSRASH